MYSSRWYDKDPTVSLAISLLRNAAENNQVKAAGYLLQQFQNYELPSELLIKKHFGIFNRRWYDFNEELYNAVENFRNFSSENQKMVAVLLINYLCTLDEAENLDAV